MRMIRIKTGREYEVIPFPNCGDDIVRGQIINPKTDKPWQRHVFLNNSDFKPMTTEPMTIDLTPSWEFAVQIYLAVLENPDANFHQVVEAKEEILRLARMVDKLKQS